MHQDGQVSVSCHLDGGSNNTLSSLIKFRLKPELPNPNAKPVCLICSESAVGLKGYNV